MLWNPWLEAVSHQSHWIYEHQDALLVFLQLRYGPQSNLPSSQCKGLDMGCTQGWAEACFRQHELGPCIVNESLTKQLNSCQLGSSLLQRRHFERSLVTTIPTSVQNHTSLRTILCQTSSLQQRFNCPVAFQLRATHTGWGVPLKVPLSISLLLPRASSESEFLTSATEKKFAISLFCYCCKNQDSPERGSWILLSLAHNQHNDLGSSNHTCKAIEGNRAGQG